MKSSSFLIAAALLASAVRVQGQGNLTPPGPPAPIMKSLDQIEARTPVDAVHTPGDSTSVFKITQSGSYFLSGDISSSQTGKSGILVAADNVTINLNGFSIICVGGTGSGIAGGKSSNVRILNGRISGWSGAGILFSGGANLVVEDILAASNGSTGILLNVAVSRVERCCATGNGFHGIATGPQSLVRNCQAFQNANTGITCGAVSKVSDCLCASNTVNGIQTGDHAQVTDCHLNNNLSVGILATNFSLIRDNNVDFSSSGTGIKVTGTYNRIDNNTVTRCATGIASTGNNAIIRNTTLGNGNAISSLGPPNDLTGPFVTGETITNDTNPSANYDNIIIGKPN